MEAGIGVVGGKRAASGQKARHSEGHEKIDRIDVNREDVSRLRTFHKDGTRQRVGAGAALCHFPLDYPHRFGELIIGSTREPQALETSRNMCFEHHLVSRRDGQDGLDACVEISPMHVLRRESQAMRLREAGRAGRAGEDKYESPYKMFHSACILRDLATGTHANLTEVRRAGRGTSTHELGWNAAAL